MQNAPFESKYGATLGRNLKEENEFAGELHFGTENKKWAVRNDDIKDKMDVKTAAHDSQAVGDRRILAYG